MDTRDAFMVREWIDRGIKKAEASIVEPDTLPFAAYDYPPIAEAMEEIRASHASMRKSISDMHRTYHSLQGCASLQVQWLWDDEVKRRRRTTPWWKRKERAAIEDDRLEWQDAKWGELEDRAANIKEELYY